MQRTSINAHFAITSKIPIQFHQNFSEVWGKIRLVVNLQNGHECFAWNAYTTHLAHTLFAFLLFFQQFLFTSDIATVALCQNVLAEGLDSFASDNLVADCGLDGDFEHLTWNCIFSFSAI